MWSYSQSTGELKREDEHVGYGYSGGGQGKNNPALQWEREIGPLPRGMYTIGDAQFSRYHGPVVLPLLPDEDNEMFGRSGFLIHGDSSEHPGAASKGCVVAALRIRQVIAASEDKRLQVVE